MSFFFHDKEKGPKWEILATNPTPLEEYRKVAKRKGVSVLLTKVEMEAYNLQMWWYRLEIDSCTHPSGRVRSSKKVQSIINRDQNIEVGAEVRIMLIIPLYGIRETVGTYTKTYQNNRPLKGDE